MKYEYGIIGGGPAGYTLANMLAEQGKKIILFEKNYIGGTCLNKGCIPTKALLHVSEIFKNMNNASKFGIEIDIKNFDFEKVHAYKNNIVQKLRKSLELATKKNGVEIIQGNAITKSNNVIVANNIEYEVNNIINATGSQPRELKDYPFDGKFILNSDDVLNLSKLPKSVLIVGSGAIGIEWARIFNNFGINVSIIEMAEHLIPNADIDVSKRIERIFKQNKINFYLKNQITKIENKTVTISNGETITPDFILVAIGRINNNKIDNSFIKLGDAATGIQLAHKAIHQAKQFALGIDFDETLIPSVIYGTPEIAWIGKKEQECSPECKKILFPISALGKSWCDDTIDGFIKIIVENNYIIGAHVISNEASSIIQQILIAMQNKINIDELKKICYPHPSYSEGIFEALLRI